jgi:uncharacterized protein (TIGR03000 family)
MYSVVLMMAMTTGGDVVPDCHRRGNCNGGCNGGGYVSACYGGGYGGCYGGGYGGGYGGCYGGGCYGGGYYGMPPRGEPLKMPGEKPKEEKPKEELNKPIGQTAPARIVVSLPADARLTIDEYTSPALSDTHIIVSSPLGTEQTRTYVLTARAMRDGKMQTVEERVTVHGGEETKVTLTLPTAVAAR